MLATKACLAVTPKAPPLRGTSMIEMLLVVSILGIITALAAPNLQPAVAGHRLYAATIEVGALLDQARRRAVSEGRCYRVRIDSIGRLAIEGRGSSDCVNLDRDSWRPSVYENVMAPGITYTIEGLTVPASPTKIGLEAADHTIIFRPNGRLYGDGDSVTSDDGARILLQNATAIETRSVIVEAIGRICSRNNGTGTPPLVRAPEALICN